jgi:hypothetical protein
MDDQQRRDDLSVKRNEFSHLSVLLISLFVIAFTVAVLVDLAALLQALNLLGGSWQTTLETGAAISTATGVPFLAMGMSISADMDRNK